MDAQPIPFSPADLERQRLESTLDRDLSSLSLTVTSAPSTSFASTSSSAPSLEVGRAANASHLGPDFHTFDDTPRGKRFASFARTESTIGVSPTSTAGHHISAATLGAGVFRRAGADRERTQGDEFDPDRSLGRLVGELAKAMGNDRMSPKPVSPFVSPRQPRSPSPAPNSIPNLSYSLNRNDPLPSPPHSRTVSAASSRSANSQAAGTASRPVMSERVALGETDRHNVEAQSVPRQSKKAYSHSAAAVGVENDSADVTGMTGLLATPARGAKFDNLDKNAGPTDGAGASIPASLATLSARLRALETERSVSRRRVRELEAEVERAREEVTEARQSRDVRLREVIAEKSALEDLVRSLREHLKRLSAELEANKTIIAELRHAAGRAASDDISDLRRDVERLSRDVARLNEIANQGLLERTRAREGRSVRLEALDLADDEVDRIRRDVAERAVRAPVAAPAVSFAAEHASFHDDPTPLPSQLRQGLHAAAAVEPGLMPPSAAPPTRVQRASSGSDGEASPTPASRTQSRQSNRPHHAPPAEHNTPTRHSFSSSTSSERRRRHRVAAGPDSPFPSIRAEDEEEFFSPSRPRRKTTSRAAHPSSRTHRRASSMADGLEPASRPSSKAPLHSVRAILENADVPPQTVLTRVIGELEADFTHYKSIYVELADQYKVLDAASAVAKRHVLAEHLKEVIDCLEQKADHIAALYSLVHVEDRSAPQPAQRTHTSKSVNDLWRAVRDSLGEEAVRRLQAEGLFRHT